jgi:hypothetical protein
MDDMPDSENVWADRLLNRHGRDVNGAKEDALRERRRYPYDSPENLFWSRVAELIAQKTAIRRRKALNKNPLQNMRKAKSLVGEECSCGGRNKNCFRCDGSGIVQPPGQTAASISVRIDVDGRRKKAACPVCGKKLKLGGVPAHMNAKHPQASKSNTDAASRKLPSTENKV